MTYTVIVQEDEHGELYIELPPELMDQLGWSIGDDLVWIVEEDGKILLRKKTDDSSHEA